MKKKNTKEAPEELENVQTAATEATDPVETTGEVPVETAQETEKAPKKEAKKSNKEAEVQEIPDSVDRILSAFPQYKELYVDNKGGVFTKGTQPNLVEGAILYQNPHYKQ